MINKKVIISLAIVSAIISSNLNTLPANAFAGYDDYNTYDNYSYNGYSDDGYSDYIYGISIDEKNAVQVIVPEDDDFSDLLYTIENNQVTITGYDETINFSYYTIPTIINGYPVTAIADYAFKDCKSLISIVIPNTVKTVGEYAFRGCKNLTSVSFEDVSYIDDSTSGTDTQEDNTESIESTEDTQYDFNSYDFGYVDNANNYGNYDETSSYDYNSYNYSYDDNSTDETSSYDYNSYNYSYDDNNTDETSSYDYNSYNYSYDDNNTNETSVSEQESETTTEEEEEEENIAINPVSVYSSSLKEGININHSGISAIMEHAFDSCINLESITVPNTLSYMGAYAIEDTLYYKNHIESNQSIILGGVYYKYMPQYSYSYEYNSNTAKYEPVVKPFDEEIPEGIVSISYSAFKNVEGMTNLTMPESLKTIYDYAFYGCTSLTEISFYDGIQYVGNNAFQNTVWLNECQGGFAITGDYLYKYVGKGGSVTIPSKVKIIGNEAFALDAKITRVVVQDGVQKIMGGSFYRCENLQTVVISGTVLSIGNQAFYGCKNLARITFNEGLLSIGEKCFVSCSKLTYAIIPSTVAQLGDMCFGFNYDDIHIAYSMIDGFTLVGDENSNVESYAKSKMLNFKSRDEFVIPKASEEYQVVINNDDTPTENTPLDVKLIIYVISGLVALLLLLSFILYQVDKKKNPKKYKKKRKNKKYIRYQKYKERVRLKNLNNNNNNKDKIHK